MYLMHGQAKRVCPLKTKKYMTSKTTEKKPIYSLAQQNRIRDYRDKTPSLLFPYPSCHSKLQFFTVSPWEEQSHVALDNETIKTVTHLSMTVPYAPGHPLPNHLPPIPTHLKAVAIVLCLIIITHKPQECYINRRDPKLEGFKMQAKVLTKATENLKIEKRNPTISLIPLTKSSNKI